MKKRILSIMLAVCMLLSIVPMAVFAVEEADIFASGDGTSAATAYTIATLEQLEAFRDAVDGGNDFSGKFIKLTADIDMSSKYGEGKESWNPIGSNTKEFNGTFDGDGHSIDELYINSTDGEDYCQGLFAIVGVGGCVKNLSVSGSVTATTSVVAGIAAVLYGTIENCHNSCDVSGNVQVGGITGKAGNGDAITISGCSNSGTIKGTGQYVGGIFGYYSWIEAAGKSCFTIKNCLNFGKVSGTGGNVGGIGGYVDYPYLVENCLNTGLVTGSGSGGIFGYCFLSSAEQVKSCYYLDTSASTGIYDGNSSTSATTLTSEQLKSEESFSGWDFTDTWVMNDFLGRPALKSNPEISLKGDGKTAATAFEISNLAELELFRDTVDSSNDFGGQFVKLTADIDMSSKYGKGKQSWNPIGNYSSNDYYGDLDRKIFNGTFDGDGHKIDNMYIEITETDDGYLVHSGLFSCVGASGCVKNLTVGGSVKEPGGDGHARHAGIVGYNKGRIENCHNACSVNCKMSGGIVGYNECMVINSYNTGSIERSISGGIANYNAGEIVNCYNMGTISGDRSGGIAANSSCIVGGCYYLDTSCSKGIFDNSGTGSATALTAEQFKSEANFSGWDFTNVWIMNDFLGRPTLRSNPENSIKGDGKTAATAFEISNLAELEAFRDAVDGGNDFSGKFIKLTADIDMSSKYGEGKASWNAIGEYNAMYNTRNKPFKGTFDGDGHKIDNMYIIVNPPSSEEEAFSANWEGFMCQGLFSYVAENGTVKNLTVGGSVIDKSSCYSYHAGIVGYNSGIVENCRNNCSVKTDGKAAGVVGINYGTVKKCCNAGKISALYEVGGIVNYNLSTVENCYNTGDVSNMSCPSGAGIVCINDGDVKNCYNIGKITDFDVSGIVSENEGSVENCYYLDSSASNGISENSGTGSATAKTAAEFANGEVAYLLQNAVAADDGQIWGQTLTGESKDTSPVLSSELSKKVCLVKFINFDGERHAKFFINYNGTVTLPTEPTVESGYKFDGWFVENSTTAFTSSTLVTGDISLYPKQSPNTFTVTYKDGKDGAIFSDQTYTVSNGDATPNFVGELGNVASYVFNGWDKTVAATVTQSVTYTAKWSDKSANTLRLLGNGGTTASGATISDSYTNDASIVTGANSFTKTGYTFKEWNTKADGLGTSYAVGATVNFTAIHNAETVTLYAIWTENSNYKIAFNDVLSGVIVKDGVKWTDTVLDGMGDMKRDGYTFDGWFRNGTKITSDMTYADLAESDATKKITLTAKWTDIENPVISGIENGKTYCSAQTVTVTDNGIIKSVTVNGKGVDLDENGKFTLNPTTGEQEIIVTDTDGNTATVKVTVNDGHTGGTATCTKQAECAVCSTPYGKVDKTNHVGDTEIKDAKAATCTEDGYTGNTHCKSCGEKLSDGKTITKLGHVDKDKNHICDRENCKATLSSHSGGEATCCEKAICDYCGKPYGDLNPENHTGEKVWTADDENHEQKWDCCGEIVVEKEEHDYKWGICEECGYEHAHRIGFAIWSFLKNAVSLVVKVVVGLVRFIKELNVFDFPCLR